MNKEDFDNFQASFEHIDDILKVLADELDQQLKDEHMNYDVTWSDETSMNFNSESTKEDRELFIELLISDALSISMQRAMGDVWMDPWSRIKGIMALRQSPEEVQSPISAAEYEEIKVTAEKAKALDLESVHVNMQRPEWTEAEQMELLMKKEKQ